MLLLGVVIIIWLFNCLLIKVCVIGELLEILLENGLVLVFFMIVYFFFFY